MGSEALDKTLHRVLQGGICIAQHEIAEEIILSGGKNLNSNIVAFV